jgi:two-component system, OmpR family, sensor histidine kinase CreC
VNGDAFLIKRALGNLLQNAIDFSPEGGVITISIREGTSTLAVVFQDEGPGVPEYALDKVFDRFFSLPRPKSSKKSSGLGLVFVKEIMELHGGSASVKNRTDGGVEVELVFKKP